MTLVRMSAHALLIVTLTVPGQAQAPQPAMGGPRDMTQVPLQTTIGEGKDRQVDLLFQGPRRKLVQITLRRGSVLERHTAAVPITIQCVTGSGTLLVGGAEPVPLKPGVLVTIEANVPHEIRPTPDVSVLLTQFTGGDTEPAKKP